MADELIPHDRYHYRPLLTPIPSDPEWVMINADIALYPRASRRFLLEAWCIQEADEHDLGGEG